LLSKLQKNLKGSRDGIKILSVQVSSLAPERIQVSRVLLEYIYDLHIDGLRNNTIINRLKKIQIFFKYLDSHNIKFQIERQSIKNALLLYSEYLNHKIKIYDKKLKNGITTNTAHDYQFGVLSLCTHLLKIDSLELLSSHYRIKTNNSQKVPSSPLTDEDCAIQFSQYTFLFRRFSSIILNQEEFPLDFELNKETYWLTHIGRVRHSKSENVTTSKIFNFNEKREYSADEIKISSVYKRNDTIQKSIDQYQKAKSSYNKLYSPSRTIIALYACRAYFMHFLFLTAENDSTAASIIFDENYSIENSKANFKSIKWRANALTVQYDIQSEFVDDFKLYLRLRSYLINYYKGENRELFLTRKYSKLVSAPTDGSYSCFIRKDFSRIFNKNNFHSNSQKIRVTKAIWVRNKYGSALSSYLLQHSKKTSDSNYTGASSRV